MASVEDRISYLEGEVKEHSPGFADLPELIGRLDEKVDRLDVKLDEKVGRLEGSGACSR